MIQVFDQEYARYYDLLYADKDYLAEAAYLFKHIARGKQPSGGFLLELGCGTGQHAVELARLGYRVRGVDLSPAMLERAERRATSLPGEFAQQLSFSQADIRDFRIEDRFDAVLALFHVISYQTTNDAVCGAFQTAAHHLHRGGLFIFDVWYGPAVWAQRPSARIRRLADSEVSITRFADPVMDPERNTVDVRYSIHCVDRETGLHKEFKESHLMRFFFLPELEFLLEQSGFGIMGAEEWMTGARPSPMTWGVTVIAEKQ